MLGGGERERERERERDGGGSPLSWQVQQHAIVARETRSRFIIAPRRALASDSQSPARCFMTLSRRGTRGGERRIICVTCTETKDVSGTCQRAADTFDIIHPSILFSSRTARYQA